MNSLQEKIIAQYMGPILNYSGLHNLFKPIYSGLGHILMFHRVLPPKNELRVHNHHSLEISPTQLENSIDFFKRRNYKFYSLDDLVINLKQKKQKEKFVVFTFDDGYYDNLEFAYPILKKHQVPFTIYVTTDFPDKNALMWWYMLEDLLLKNNKVEFTVDNKELDFNCNTHKEKESAFYSIRSIFNSIDDMVIKKIFEEKGLDWKRYAENLSLDWEQIKHLANDNIVTIGAHTITHRNLRKLSLNEAEHEIRASKLKIENYISKPVKHFSYPYGKRTEASHREFELVKKQGFSTATTTRLANVFSQHSENLEALPRITINSYVNKHLLKLLSSGVLPAYRNKLKKVIVY